MDQADKATESFIGYCRSWLGVPYIWGGNNPLEGFDCGGFVLWCLRSRGLVGIHEDLSAQGLFDKIRKKGTVYLDHRALVPGCLIFYGKTASTIEHVAIVLDRYTVIEAGGGDSSCKTVDRAKELGACVRERLITQRLDIQLIIEPVYPWS